MENSSLVRKMHVDWDNIDQINSIAKEESGASGDNTVLEEESLHESNLINEWGQG